MLFNAIISLLTVVITAVMARPTAAPTTTPSQALARRGPGSAKCTLMCSMAKNQAECEGKHCWDVSPSCPMLLESSAKPLCQGDDDDNMKAKRNKDDDVNQDSDWSEGEDESDRWTSDEESDSDRED